MARRPVSPFTPNRRHGQSYYGSHVNQEELVQLPLVTAPKAAEIPVAVKHPRRTILISRPDITYITDMVGHVIEVLHEEPLETWHKKSPLKGGVGGESHHLNHSHLSGVDAAAASPTQLEGVSHDR